MCVHICEKRVIQFYRFQNTKMIAFYFKVSYFQLFSTSEQMNRGLFLDLFQKYMFQSFSSLLFFMECFSFSLFVRNYLRIQSIPGTLPMPGCCSKCRDLCCSRRCTAAVNCEFSTYKSLTNTSEFVKRCACSLIITT